MADELDALPVVPWAPAMKAGSVRGGRIVAHQPTIRQTLADDFGRRLPGAKRPGPVGACGHNRSWLHASSPTLVIGHILF